MTEKEIMQIVPIFKFLDGVVADYGVYILVPVVWASGFLIVWILKGGLRRKRLRQDSRPHISITIVQPAANQHQPIAEDKPNSRADNDRNSFAA